MSSGIHVLCVDDDPDIRSVTTASLERASDELSVATAATGRDALSRLRDEEPIDCIVSDYEMPGLDGLELLEAVRERDPELPFILFTGRGSESIASEAISAGVTDYLQKGTGGDQYTVLANRIENAVAKRRADRARRESERELERYRTLVESVDDPMYVLDHLGRCTVANDAFCTLLDVDREAVVGEHITEFISRSSFERGIKTVRNLYVNDEESDRFEVTVETDGGDRWIGEANVTVLTDDDGEFAGSTAVIRDITERKRRERELAEYERIIELVPTALFVLDAEGTITWCNDEFADAFAEDVAELQGTAFPALVERGYYADRVMEKYAEEVRRLLSSSTDLERAKYRVRFRSPDGEELIHDVHTRLLPLEDGEFAGTIHAIRDITRRRRYQNELERQNERLEGFASVVSHDLRNPLNVAQGSLELHAEDCPAADDDSIEQVRSSLGRMDELIENLLSLARHGRTVGDPEPVDLERLVREAWNAVETADAVLDCRVDRTIVADGGRLRALFENLFRNAIEHGGSDVTVTVEWLEDDTDTDVSSPVFYVADDGSGLETAPRELFEFGHTSAEDGTGFGLAIVQQIVEAHGWTVTASEGRDGGARFEFEGVTIFDDEPARD
ncbi:PAS domain S-box protein [Haloterrigena alkaliphila]|uniref:histidine kinase n=1 Tax=Haloterrigena alkaliphila TaxID=2816475 RepID=A0A8A2VHH2_9EURY|nr:PAS domain S-box protein [Haloterrigena alkaliphila]QSX00151.1 PAS domain S-box protein [Haloterrigena alkaliphila]